MTDRMWRHMRLPNFLVIGVAKAGTTSLYSYLAQHPDIFLSPIKETNFFALEGQVLDFRGPGDDKKIGRTSITALDRYLALFAEARSEQSLGEVSPFYLYYPNTAGNIFRYIPHVRLIVVLRNPVDRAYSSYLHLRRDGREPMGRFSSALEAEENRIRKNWAPLWHYRRAGLYFEQLKRFYERFPRSRIRIYLFEEFCSDPVGTVQDMYGYLDLDATFSPDVTMQRNASGIPKRPWLHRALNQAHPTRTAVKTLLPASLREKATVLLSKMRNGNLHKPGLGEELRRRLLAEYREDILHTQDLIDRDLGAWLS